MCRNAYLLVLLLGILLTFLCPETLHTPGRAQNISLVGELKPFNGIQFGDVWGEGDLACVGVFSPYTAGYGVGIISITNPASPALLSIYNTSPSSNNQFEQGVVRDRIGYFASWSGSGGVQIVSLTNAASPVMLSRITASTSGTVTNGHNRVHTMFLDGNYLYEADHLTPTVKVFDVSDPAAPVFVRNIVSTDPVKVHQITVAGNRLFTSGWGNETTGVSGKTDIYDVSNIGTQAPPLLGSIVSGPKSHSSWPTTDGRYLVSCRESSIDGDIRIYDINDPANAVEVVRLNPSNVGLEAGVLPHNPVVIGDLLFVSWYQAGLQVFNISNPVLPVRVGSYDTYPSPKSSTFQGNWGVYPFLGLDRVLLSDMQRGLLVVDCSAVLTATNNYPPMILGQPTNQTVNAGQTATFAVTATGSSPAYQWRLNGADVPGATASTLVVSNAQSSNAGAYSVVVSNSAGVRTSATAMLAVEVPMFFQTVFADDFDADTSTNWLVFPGSGNGGDYTAEWAFDYSAAQYTSNGVPGFIPQAPGDTNGTTRALKLTVNGTDATAAVAGVSLYPKDQSFNGAYRLKFDMWMNYPGGAGGGAGSTEMSTFGLNHEGARVNWDSSTSTPSDGVWFAVTGDGGDSSDYRAYVGNPSGRPTLLSFSSSGIGASGASSANSSASYFQGIFTAPPFESQGAPGKQWVQVEVGQDVNNVLTWRINGNLIAQRTNTSSYTSGTVMIGYMDLFSSIAGTNDGFLLIDNLRVEMATTSAPPSILIQPASQEVLPGGNATFSVAVSGSAPLSYQWRFNGAAISGATASSYSVVDVHQEDAGVYSVVITNTAGSVTSSNAILTIVGSVEITDVRAIPGARAALITWTTGVPATSQVDYGRATEDGVAPAGAGQVSIAGHGEFENASSTDTNLVTQHSVLLTGLVPDSHYEFRVNSYAGTNLLTSGGWHFDTAGTLVLDNPEATFTGVWTPGTVSADKYSTNYHFALTVTGSATATATYIPTITTPGKYDVYVWYPQGANRPADARHEISHAGGMETVQVNQTANGGDWRLIAAARPFAAGTNGFVRVSNLSAEVGKAVMADGVRWVYSDGQEPPDFGTVPLWWSEYYFGASVNPLLDHDLDGYSTAAEYLMGTSPIDPESHFRFTIQSATNGVRFVFSPHHEDRVYELQERTNVQAGVWSPVTTGHSALNPYGEAGITLTNTASSKAFFRMSVHQSSVN